MSNPTEERLYNLLPASYRIRDYDAGEPLRALLGIIDEVAQQIEGDISGLYDDWFIETCQEWVVPYIGDLLGVRGLLPTNPSVFSARAYVANTLHYRRRKGTVQVLEELARDVTGWPAHAVEFFKLLATTQHFNHIRPLNYRTPDLRDTARLELLGGPFESAAHTGEVRHIYNQRGRYNIPNIGIFLWRLLALPVYNAPATPASAGCFRFSQLGADLPLFNHPLPQEGDCLVSGEPNVPGRLRRRPLYDELEARRRAIAAGETPTDVYFADAAPPGVAVACSDHAVLSVHVDGEPLPIAAAEIAICDLSAWTRPLPASAIRVAVDPLLGRLAFRADQDPAACHVCYYYGFSSEMAGGFYDRHPQPIADAVVQRVAIAGSGNHSLANAWNALSFDTSHEFVIEIADSETYAPFDFELPADVHLTIRAANEQRPLITGATWRIKLNAGARLALSGLLIATATQVTGLGTAAAELDIVHCTLVPGLTLAGDGHPHAPDAASLTLTPGSAPLRLNIEKSIVGRLALLASANPAPPLPRNTSRPVTALSTRPLLPAEADAPSTHSTNIPTPPAEGWVETELAISDSIVDGTGGLQLALAVYRARIERCTIIGDSHFVALTLADNSIFTGVATVERRQEGCVRFSYLPPTSRTPQRYHCQPDLALLRRATELGLASRSDLSPAQAAAVYERLTPAFTSRRYADPGYAQLSLTCALELRSGADNSNEMGVWGDLMQQNREANLRSCLDEYLRFGLEAGIFFVT